MFQRKKELGSNKERASLFSTYRCPKDDFCPSRLSFVKQLELISPRLLVINIFIATSLTLFDLMKTPAKAYMIDH